MKYDTTFTVWGSISAVYRATSGTILLQIAAALRSKAFSR